MLFSFCGFFSLYECEFVVYCNENKYLLHNELQLNRERKIKSDKQSEKLRTHIVRNFYFSFHFIHSVFSCRLSLIQFFWGINSSILIYTQRMREMMMPNKNFANQILLYYRAIEYSKLYYVFEYVMYTYMSEWRSKASRLHTLYDYFSERYRWKWKKILENTKGSKCFYFALILIIA